LARKVHGNLYDYSLVNYTFAKEKIQIICKKHGIFCQEANSHLYGVGCPICHQPVTDPQQELIEFLHDENVIVNDRKILGNKKELDIYLPDFKIGIEFNGIYWHSFDKLESTKERQKHLTKFKECKQRGIQLFQVSELEWKDPIKREIWKSLLRNKLGKTEVTIPARKTKFVQITKEEAIGFLETNHLQGSTNAIKYTFGLKYQDKLVGVITFCNHQKTQLNLSRMAFKLNTSVVGGASKLLKHSLEYLPKYRELITFSNNLYSSGKIYETLGFQKDKELPCSYEWWKPNTKNSLNKRQFRHKYLQNKLEKYDPELTEAENMFSNGYRRIWDAGYIKWKLGE